MDQGEQMEVDEGLSFFLTKQNNIWAYLAKNQESTVLKMVPEN